MKILKTCAPLAVREEGSSTRSGRSGSASGGACDASSDDAAGASRRGLSSLPRGAGAGNGALLQGLGFPQPQMQLRPLHQVLVRHHYPHPMYAHCLTGTRTTEPRMTITSHQSTSGALWYLGGQIASDGVGLTSKQQQAHALTELRACVPWIRWDDASIETLQIDRAEPLHPGGQRPDHAFAQADGPLVTCWPTKLSLVPDLADRVQALLGDSSPGATESLALPRAALGSAPWEA